MGEPARHKHAAAEPAGHEHAAGEPAGHKQTAGDPAEGGRGGAARGGLPERLLARVPVAPGGLVTLTTEVFELLGITAGDYVHLRPVPGGIELHRIDLKAVPAAPPLRSAVMPLENRAGGGSREEPPPLSVRSGHLALRPVSSSSSSSS